MTGNLTPIQRAEEWYRKGMLGLAPIENKRLGLAMHPSLLKDDRNILRRHQYAEQLLPVMTDQWQTSREITEALGWKGARSRGVWQILNSLANAGMIEKKQSSGSVQAETNLRADGGGSEPHRSHDPSPP